MENLSGLKVHIRGIVQGVGFRPFVYNLATSLALTGWVCNTSRGVEIEVNGPSPVLEEFTRRLRIDAPPLARIDSFLVTPCQPDGYALFSIIESQPQPGDFIPISPDVSICPDCRRELFDPADRRFRYPFINCTNCGPRFTIIQDIPYDRPKTTMSGFPLCPECDREYHNPADRRFHAQPVACPVCGPKIWLQKDGQRISENDEAVLQARAWMNEGLILAIKGLGGFHLACDAANAAAVSRLRDRKRRSDKPFALMAFDIPAVQAVCDVSEEEIRLLSSPAHPIVLLPRKKDGPLPPELAPHQSSLGIMLAYTPLHLLLLEPATGFSGLLVMTSGNLSEEPIAYADEDAMDRLSPLADAFLLHNRPIHMRVDDSVARVIENKPYPVRRARGYAPDPISLAWDGISTLAAGAELKNTFCLTRDRYAFISHHIGDLENFETLRSYEEGIIHYEKLFRIQPQFVACDLHPDYLSTRYARQRAEDENLPLMAVQHHHAHLAACLAENAHPAEELAVGLCFDGTGLGLDGKIWGGEILTGSYAAFTRNYHLAYFPLPGGDASIRKPARTALSLLYQLGLEWEPDLPPMQHLCYEERTALRVQLDRKLNVIATSSMGRLFDAVSALLGVCQQINYEGQAAIELEALADPAETGLYNLDVQSGIIDPAPLISQLLADWRSGVSLPRLSARFHNSLARVAADLAGHLCQITGAKTVALSGGVWQNKTLLNLTLSLLRQTDLKILIHRQLPPNDGCISLGQAAVARFSSPQVH
ncbi:MAG TPA: carbamoyltransferase HypF [Anaerolineaceae bacterium]|nr:carbamoyltransferase HypF [Anaerolineaceae bacterium]HPN50881.1 carbamoyltransferase HypF [Anaerolineaceae bacterium]